MNLEFLTDEQVQEFKERMRGVYMNVDSSVSRGWVMSEMQAVVFHLRQLGVHDVIYDPKKLYEALKQESKDRAY